MDEIIKSIKAYLYDKATSPLFGSFILAWLVWNYRVVLAVFSDEKVESKFRIIEKVFENVDVMIFDQQINFSGHLLHGFFIPAAITILYIYGYPVLAKPVYGYSLLTKNKLREEKQKKENMQLLSEKDSRELRQKLALLQGELDKESEWYRKQEASLSQTIVELEQKLDQRTVENDRSQKDASNSLSKDEEEVLAEFAGLDDAEGRVASRVQEVLGWHIDKVRMHLDTLVQKNYLHKESLDSGRITHYLLSPLGRRYLVENGLFQRKDRSKPA